MNNQDLLKSPFRFYAGLHTRNVVLGLGFLLVTDTLEALPPLFIGIALDQITQHAPFFDVAKTVLVIFAITTFLSLSRFMWRIFWGRFTHTACMDLQNRIFYKFLQLSQSFLRKNRVGELMSLLINDVQAFRMGIGPGVLIMLDALFSMAVYIPLMLYISPEWTWKTLVLIPLLPFAAHKLMKLLNAAYETRQNHFAEMSGKAQEIVSGIRVIKSFAQTESHVDQFNKYSSSFERSCVRTAKIDASFTPIIEFAVAVGRVILLVIGAAPVMNGQVSIGAFFTFYQYIQKMEWPASALGYALSYRQQGDASFRRISELLVSPDEVPAAGSRQIAEFETLEFRHVSFRYPGASEDALQDVNFIMKAGEVLGLIGPLGSGKSTLIELLSGVYRPTSGWILVNGIPLDELSRDALTSLLAIVPQESFLFSDSVEENIRFGAEASEVETWKALDIVDVKSEVESLAMGLGTVLGERGVNLSGGQKQRLTLARALVRRSPVVVLDDSLSAVDTRTETRILRQIVELYNERHPSLILISHRVDSIAWADRILVLNNGRVESAGTHTELLRQSETYKKLVHIQGEQKADESATLS